MTRELPPHDDRDSPAILVIEDDAEIREALRMLLEDLGLPVIEASNGCEGLARLREQHPSLVLLDLMMPVMNGWQFLERYRRDPMRAPVVVVSAFADRATVGADQVIAKPLRVDRLLRVIESYVEMGD